MTGWNLPPGCSESDIPGNRPIDVWLENNLYKIWEDYDEKKYDNLHDEYNDNPDFYDYVESLYEDYCEGANPYDERI